MKLRKEEDIVPINVAPGDGIILTYKDENGEVHELIRDEITEEAVFDRVAIFDLLNELGFEKAIGGAFGKKKEKK